MISLNNITKTAVKPFKISFKLNNYLFIILSFITFTNCTKSMDTDIKKNQLTEEEQQVILHKGTELPYSGKYYKFKGLGTYTCKQCGAALYKSSDKFDSGCGWPSFDDEIPGAVKRQLDVDGQRTEIICAKCGAHLGHVFTGENLTPKNIRHCVNSISLNFIADNSNPNIDSVYFASGCFWGTQYFMEKAEGVISTSAGYTGGSKENPSYEEVCTGKTGHYESVKIVFDKTKTNFTELAKLFFETHDPTQTDGQGPDIGQQYRSAIFYTNSRQKEEAEKLIKILEDKGMRIATKLIKAGKFWEAESYHQEYYNNKGTKPYCHFYKKKF